jgi:hypothetical protein
MSELVKQLFYKANQDLTQAPRSVRIAIRTNLIITFWLPTAAMAISDYYLGRIPNLVVIIFTLALFVLYAKMYEDTTRFSLHPLLIHLSTFSTLFMLFIISFYKDWPLQLVIAESVAIEILAFVLGLVVLYLWVNLSNRKLITEKENTKNESWKSRLLFSALVLMGLASFVLVIYFRFEGVFVYFIDEIIAQPSEAIYLLLPFGIVVVKYIFLCYNHLMDDDADKAKNNQEIDIISLNYGVPMLLNLLVPLIMYLALYYVPKS